MPHPDLNWVCAACYSGSSVAAYRCRNCKVGLCRHFAVIVMLPEHVPISVCTECKQAYNDRQHPDWKFKRMLRQKGIRF